MTKGNDISQAQDWCAYVKRGRASIGVCGNTIHHRGTGGFTAGQGSGLEYMVVLWLTLEVMETVWKTIPFTTPRAPDWGVNGGFDIRMMMTSCWCAWDRAATWSSSCTVRAAATAM